MVDFLDRLARQVAEDRDQVHHAVDALDGLVEGRPVTYVGDHSLGASGYQRLGPVAVSDQDPYLLRLVL